jgi:hypothetical protein
MGGGFSLGPSMSQAYAQVQYSMSSATAGTMYMRAPDMGMGMGSAAEVSMVSGTSSGYSSATTSPASSSQRGAVTFITDSGQEIEFLDTAVNIPA